MKEIFRNKKTVSVLLVALLIGGLVGWLIKPGTPQDLTSSDHQHAEAVDEVWTCSMHPQIRLSEPGSCPICGMALIPATSKNASGGTDHLVQEMSPEAVAMANIHTSRVNGTSAEGELFLTGKIKADERQIASVTAKFPGRIEEMYVNFTGEAVKSGDKLASIYSPELVIAQKELLEATSSKAAFPELYSAARQKLNLWKLSEKQIDEIETLGKVRNQLDVFSDKSGIVTQRNITVGDYVAAGSVLFEVVDLSKVWILIDAYETDLPFIEIGDQVSFTAAGIPGQSFTAPVSFIGPTINPETRTVSLRAEIPNKNGELKPEMFVNARIHTKLKRGQSSLTIPRTSLLWSGKRSIVYVKVQDSEFPAFEMREITIGPRMGDSYLVEAGLEAGEEIVTNGVFAIDAAAQLSGNYSMMMRPHTKTIDVPQTFREQITAVADAYFEVKNGLVEDNVKLTETALDKVVVALDQVEMEQLKEQPHDHWMALQQQLSEAIKLMRGADQLDDLRMHFASLSTYMIDLTETFGLEKDKVYKAYCPMALNDQGAYWLSETDQIRNPYFGASMLACGEIKETYLKGQKVFEKGGPAVQQAAEGHNH